MLLLFFSWEIGRIGPVNSSRNSGNDFFFLELSTNLRKLYRDQVISKRVLRPMKAQNKGTSILAVTLQLNGVREFKRKIS